MLILTLVTPGHGTPDIVQQVPMETLDQCFKEAKAFVDHGIPKLAHDHGIVAVVGSCRSLKVEGDDDT